MMLAVPGKIFILGEYSVMLGGSAVITTLKPMTQVSVVPHTDSPAGKFFIQNQIHAELQFEHMTPGFGSSTAELIVANSLLKNPWDTKTLWTWYRKNFSPASGADLVAQIDSMSSGLGFYHIKMQELDYTNKKLTVKDSFLNNTLVFQAPEKQKLKTHDHLNKNKKFDLNRAEAIVQSWTKSFNPQLLDDYADLLESVETDFSKLVRHDFKNISGVSAVKGCGAGLNDAFLVCVSHPLAMLKNQLSHVSEKHQLQFLGSLNDVTH